MTVRFYVTSAALMIFSWLATTFLRDVPMDSYPRPPAVAASPIDPTIPMAASAREEPLLDAVRTPSQPPVRFISTATP